MLTVRFLACGDYRGMWEIYYGLIADIPLEQSATLPKLSGPFPR